MWQSEVVSGLTDKSPLGDPLLITLIAGRYSLVTRHRDRQRPTTVEIDGIDSELHPFRHGDAEVSLFHCYYC